MTDNEGQKKDMSWGGLIIRFIIVAIVLIVTSLFTPGYSISSFWVALIQGIVIVGLDYIIEAITGMDASPFGRGISGFLVSALIIYLTKFIIPGVHISVFGAIVAALVIGIISYILPIKVM